MASQQRKRFKRTIGSLYNEARDNYLESQSAFKLYSAQEAELTDLVATWEVSLPDGHHVVEFEHGTTSGKRVVWVDGKAKVKNDWMFKLVGREHFQIGKVKCTVNIEAVSGFAYEYTLEVNGKSLKKFSENQSKIQKCWVCSIAGTDTRIVLERNTLDIWVNGRRVETTGEFVEDGTETHFVINDSCAGYVKATSSGKKKTGIVHELFIADNLIPEAKE